MDEQLAAVGIERTGPAEDHRVRSWSTVFSLPTTAGRIWFKAAGPTTSFEVPLYPLIHRIAPQQVLTPIAADVARSWLLLPDGGRPLAGSLSGPELIAVLSAVLPAYGQMQRDLTPHVPDLLELGVPDMRPTIMRRRFDEALAVARRYVERHGDESDHAATDAIAGLQGAFAAWCGRLAASPVAPSLDHGDLHPGNILTGEAGVGRPVRCFDWGESVIAHPFTSLLIPLRFVQQELGVGDDDPAVERVRDAYLEAFSDLAPHAELVATLEAACQVGKVVRALVWASLARDTGWRSHTLHKWVTRWLGSLHDPPYYVAPRKQRAGTRTLRRATQLGAAPETGARAELEEHALSNEGQADLANQTGSDVWASPAWRALALVWVDEQLAAAGIERTGDVENDRVRAWSTVFSVQTSAGRIWFKAAGPATAFEVPLYQLMHLVVPAFVLAPVAADARRGWVLLPDGGRPLADYLSGPELIDALAKVLPRYGQMQRDLAPHAADMLALGVPDMRSELMPWRFNRALVAVNRHVGRYGHAAARASFRRLADLRPTFDSWCERLAALPGAATLDHNDLHPYNILVADATGITGAKVFDWGDSVLAHPFTSLLIPLRWAQSEYGVSHDDPIIQRLRDAYLEAFSDLAPHAELVTAVELACRLGMVTRALAWAAAANDAGPQGRGHRQRAFEWLTYLLEDSYLGRV